MKKLLLYTITFICISASAFAQLTGIYTINSTSPSGGTNFTSFTDAINAINQQGVGAAGVSFRVSTGQTFNERPPVLYTSGTVGGPILFGKFGAGSNPIIIPSTPGTVAIGTTISALGANGDGVIRIAGSDFVTFDGIDIGLNSSFTTAAQNYEYGYLILRKTATDACQNVTIKNATITLLASMPNSAGIYTSNLDSTGTAITATAVSGRVENLVIRKNTIVNAYVGIELKGYAHSVSPYNLFDHFVTVDSNNIQGFGGSSVECYGIYIVNQDSALISDNTMTSFSTAANTYGVRPAATTNASLFILRNTISLNSTSGGIYAIDNSAGGSGSGNIIEISGNTITNCSASSGSVYLIRGAASATTMNISNNEISNITNSGTGTMYAIYSIPSGSVTTSKVFKNHVHHLVNSSSSNTSPLYLHICNSAPETHVYQNNFHDLVHNGAIGTIIGRSNTSNFYYYNNTVSRLYTPNTTNIDAIHAIELNSGTTNQKVFFNSIYLDASSTSDTSFGSTCLYISSSIAAEVRNNILVNRSIPGTTSGYVAAYRRSSTTLTSYDTLSNNNCFYADTLLTKRVVYADGTNFFNINAYKNLVGPNRDAASFFELPPFSNVTTSPYNLALSNTNTLCSNSASVVSTPVNITTDQIGVLRSTTPDIGAFEITQPLPVDHILLKAETAGSNVVLNWETANEQNCEGFYVERGQDGKSFEAITYVKAIGKPNSNTQYLHIDEKVMNTNAVQYYRIKQVDYNHNNRFSNLVKVASTNSPITETSVYPNPFQNNLTINLQSSTTDNANIEITDMNGRVVASFEVEIHNGTNSITCPQISELHNGIYFLKLKMGTVRKIIKLIKTN